MQAPPSSLPHQPAGHGTSSAASGPGLKGSVGSVCSSYSPSHFSLFQTVNLGSGLTVFFSHFHGSEPSNVFMCKMPGDLRLFRPEDWVARPPPRLPRLPRLDGSRSGRGHWSCSLFSEGGDSPLAVEQGLSREDVGSDSALDSGRVASPDSVQREPRCGEVPPHHLPAVG